MCGKQNNYFIGKYCLTLNIHIEILIVYDKLRWFKQGHL